MEKFSLLFVFVFTILISNSYSQSPEGFKYQAVVRNSGGSIIGNQTVGMRLTIQQGSIGGTSVYSETFSETTNSYGLINLEIGTGTSTDDFTTIDWANGPYYIETAVDVSGGTSYVVMGTSQLMSVPYALYAKTAESVTNDQVDDADADPNNEIQNISLSGSELSISGGDTVTLPADNDWGLNGSAIYNLNSGSVGIGTSSPQKKLHVFGEVTEYPNPEPANGNDGVFIDIQNAGLGYQKVAGIRFKAKYGLFGNAYYHAGIFFRGDAGDIDQRGSIFFCNKDNANATGVGTADADMVIRPNGYIGINTASPTANLSVNGTANKTGGGSWAVFSDANLKKNIKPYTDGLSTLLKIQTKRFQYNGLAGIKNTEQEYVGIIAQDIQKIAPYMVREVEYKDNISGEEGQYLEFDPSALDFMIINAVKELSQEIEALKSEITRLKMENQK